MYDQIARNRRATVVLVAALGLLYSGAGSLLVVWIALLMYDEFAEWPMFWPSVILLSLAVGLLTAAGQVLYAWWKGSRNILEVTDAHLVFRVQYPQLYNIVEEMAVAAGIPAPGIFVKVDESPNAFAVGLSPKRSDVVVTTGLLDLLSRDELQGVIAHEIAHIRNYDTRLMTFVTALLGPAARASAQNTRPERSEADRTDAIMGMVFGLNRRRTGRDVVGEFVARALGMALSRQREHLADATAALLTRYPDALANALEKIARSPCRLQAGPALLHLFIVNPAEANVVAEDSSDRWTGRGSWFQTHPPLLDRIQRLRGMGMVRGQRPEARGQGPEVGGQGPNGGGQVCGVIGSQFAGDTRGTMGSVASSGSRSLASGVWPPGPDPASPVCPRCRAELMEGKIAGKGAMGCNQCGGVWMHGVDFDEVLGTQPSALDAADRRYPNLVGSGWDLVNARTCPVCCTTLLTGTTQQPIRVTLDRCPDCGGLWFDDGELSALVWAAKRPTGS